MPRTKEIEQYPDQYLEYTEKAGLGGEVRVVMPEVRRALSIRSQYYAFVGALRRKRHVYESPGLPLEPYQQRVCDAAQLSFKVMCSVEATGDGTATIVWTNRDNSWQAKALATATFTEPKEVPLEIRASLAALATKGEGK